MKTMNTRSHWGQSIAHNTPVYRLDRMIEAYHDYIAGRIDKDVWDNYSHGGYLTRRGLYRSTCSDKMKRVAMSHVIITDTGKSGHDARVSIR